MSLATKPGPTAVAPAGPIPAATRGSVQRSVSRVLQRWQLYVLLLPLLVYFAVFKYWPMYGVQIAFRNFNPVDGFLGSPWVGLDVASHEVGDGGGVRKG